VAKAEQGVGRVGWHIRELRAHAPQTVAGYLAMARATADRALDHGLLKPESAEALLGVLSDGGAANGTNGPGAPGPGEKR